MIANGGEPLCSRETPRLCEALLEKGFEVLLETNGSLSIADVPPEDFVFDIATYKKSLFGMFSGETTEVTIEAHRSLIDAIFDLFGENTRIISGGENKVRFAVDVQVSDLFFGWCCSFGDKVKLLGPDSIVEQMRQYAASIKDQYERENDGK